MYLQKHVLLSTEKCFWSESEFLGEQLKIQHFCAGEILTQWKCLHCASGQHSIWNLLCKQRAEVLVLKIFIFWFSWGKAGNNMPMDLKIALLPPVAEGGGKLWNPASDWSSPCCWDVRIMMEHARGMELLAWIHKQSSRRDSRLRIPPFIFNIPIGMWGIWISMFSYINVPFGVMQNGLKLLHTCKIHIWLYFGSKLHSDNWLDSTVTLWWSKELNKIPVCSYSLKPLPIFLQLHGLVLLPPWPEGIAESITLPVHPITPSVPIKVQEGGKPGWYGTIYLCLSFLTGVCSHMYSKANTECGRNASLLAFPWLIIFLLTHSPLHWYVSRLRFLKMLTSSFECSYNYMLSNLSIILQFETKAQWTKH